MTSASKNATDEDLLLKILLFHMHQAGLSQDAMASYVRKSKHTVNAVLKPLQKKESRNER